MVLTDRQRSDLHAGIYEYLISRGSPFTNVAELLAEADPDCCRRTKETTYETDEGTSSLTPSKSSSTPLLEKKWTAVPRLQRRVLELERQLSTTAKIHAHRVNVGISMGDDDDPASSTAGRERRFLPRPPAVHTLQSHSASVTAVSIHPVYTLAASGSEDGTIKLWDFESGEYVRTLRGHTNVVTSVDFGPNGAYLISSSTDMSVKLWDTKDNYTCVRTLRGHDHTVSCVKFVPPNMGALYLERLGTLSNSDNGDSAAGAETASKGGGIDAYALGAKYAVSASRDATVKFWDLETGFCDHTLTDHGDWVRCIAVRPPAVKINTTGEKYNSGTNRHNETNRDETEQIPSASESLALLATSGNDRNIYIYNAYDKREKLAELRGHDHVVESLSFLCSPLLPKKGIASSAPSRSKSTSSSTEERVATSSCWDYLASASRDRTVRLWTIANGGSCLMTFRAHENWARGVIVHPSGNHLLSCGDDRTIRVFDIKSNRCLRTIEDAHPHFVTCISMHPTLPIMISGGVDHTVKCWQLD